MYAVYAVAKESGTHKTHRCLLGTYNTRLLAEWWCYNAPGVWIDGPDGPRAYFCPRHRCDYWTVVEVP